MLNFTDKKMRTAVAVAVAEKIKSRNKTQIDALVNICKENIASLQSTRCNEVWNRMKDKVNKAEKYEIF